MVLPGDGAERRPGAKLAEAARAVAAWLVVRRNARRFRIELSFIDAGLSVIDRFDLVVSERAGG
jgi:hypothetical protein